MCECGNASAPHAMHRCPIEGVTCCSGCYRNHHRECQRQASVDVARERFSARQTISGALQEIGTRFDDGGKDLMPPASFWPAYDAAVKAAGK